MPLRAGTRRWIIVASVIVALLLVGGFAFVSYFMHAVYETEQVLGDVSVPAAVRESFAKRFPGASDVAWELEDDLYEAEFSWQGQKEVEAHFAADGTWSKTVSPIQFSELPEKAQLYLKTQDGYDATEPERIQEAGSNPVYEVKLANKLMEWNCQFDAEGALVSKTRDGPVLE